MSEGPLISAKELAYIIWHGHKKYRTTDCNCDICNGTVPEPVLEKNECN